MVAAPARGSVYSIVVQAAGEETARGVGVLVADELVLTVAELLDRGDLVLVADPATGARYVAVVRARTATLALLFVPGLHGDAVTVAGRPPVVGGSVHLLKPTEVRQDGVLHSVADSDSTSGPYRFTMTVGDDEFGAPVMNNCRHLVSLASGWLETGDEGFDPVIGLGLSQPDLVLFLDEVDIPYSIESDPCPTVKQQLDQAKASSADLEEERQALIEELDELEESREEDLQQGAERLAEVTAERVALQKRLDETSTKLAAQDSIVAKKTRLQTDLDAISAELDLAEQSMAEQARQARLRLYSVAGAGAALIFLASLLVWRSWRRRRDMQDALHEADAKLQEAEGIVGRQSLTFPDFLLSGSGFQGEEVRVKVNGSALVRNEKGAVIGRSSTHADYVVGETSVSRSHIRLFVNGGKLTIEDLGSLNGTRIDGVKLVPGHAYAVSNGTSVSLGDVDLTIYMLGTAD